MSLAELIEKRARLAAEMRALYEGAESENRGFNADEDEKWAKMDSDIQALDTRIKAAEKLQRTDEAAYSQSRGTRVGGKDTNGQSSEDDGAPDYAECFRSWLQYGSSGVTPEQRQMLADRSSQSPEVRAFAAGVDNAGGFTVPPEFLEQLEVAMQQWGGMLQASEIIRTGTGATLPMPTFNRVAAKATIIGENTQLALDASTPFGSVNMGAFTYATNVLPVSLQFMQDSAFGEGFIIDNLGEQIGRGLNEHLTIGTGSGQPNGIVTAASSGKVGNTGQTLSVIYDDLIDLEHSVDPAYRPGGSWMLHDTSLAVVRKLKDANNLPLWQPAITQGAPNTLLNYPYIINQDMPVMAVNAKSIIFGRLDKYKTRIVRDVSMMRLTERYADFLQVGFLAFMRADGNLLDAGTNPVKFYQNSAT